MSHLRTPLELLSINPQKIGIEAGPIEAETIAGLEAIEIEMMVAITEAMALQKHDLPSMEPANPVPVAGARLAETNL